MTDNFTPIFFIAWREMVPHYMNNPFVILLYMSITDIRNNEYNGPNLLCFLLLLEYLTSQFA